MYTTVNNLAPKSIGITSSGTTYTGHYRIALSVYPKDDNASVIIDSWGQQDTYFDAMSATYNGTAYTFTEGNDRCSITDGATNPYVISIGSYTSMVRYIMDSTSDGYYTHISGEVGEIAPSSSYQEPGYGSLGTKFPEITAPGRMIIAAFNSGYVENYTSNVIKGYDPSNPLGLSSGTSMATPCAGGIVALWLQVDPTLTIEDVKSLMEETAITDSYTSGTNANMFGSGKINALAGIRSLLEKAGPVIDASPPGGVNVYDSGVFSHPNCYCAWLVPQW